MTRSPHRRRMTLHYWFMAPVATLVATVAMASGVEGATFFAPIFLLALGLSPEVAIGTGLITEVFGFASGVTAYIRRGLVDYRLAGTLLTATVPLALLGGWATPHVRPGILQAVLGVGLVGVALSFLQAPDHDEIRLLDGAAERQGARSPAPTVLTTASGEEIRYAVCNRAEGAAIAGLGALFMGMISTGLGELNGYFLLRRCRVPARVAVATGVVVVAVTALAAASLHLTRFARTGGEVLGTVLSICAFTVPGVVIGGQLGPRVAARIPQSLLERSLGVLFALVGLMMLARVAL